MMKTCCSFTKLISLTIIGIALTNSSSIAQGIVNNGAKISVAAGTYFVVDNGGFTNETSGQVANAGTMYVDGDWENNDASGVFGASPTVTTGGVVILDGATQNITGTEETNFYNLTIEGSDKKTLSGVDASAFGTLTLSSQSLRLNSQTLTLENAGLGPAAISNTGGFIISESAPSSGAYGTLKWNVGNGTGNYTIPFGTDVGSPSSLAMGYNITSAGTPSSAYKTFATYGTDDENSFTGPNITTNPSPTDWTDLPFTVNHLTDDYIQAAHYWVTDRFWIIDEDNIGQGNGGYGTNPQVEYVFKYLDAEIAGSNHITEGNLVAQRYNHDLDKWGDWLYGAPGVILNAAANEVTLQITNDLDLYPVWTLVDNSDPLPIELTQFVGECSNGSMKLSWTTYTETNNDFFTLERSDNGTEFEMVDIIEGAGNSNEPINYSVADDLPLGGTSYYRLKNTAFSGKAEYSDVIAVACGTSENDFNFVRAYDVEHRGFIVEFTATNGEDFTATLFDASGRLMMDVEGSSDDGLNKIELSSGDLAQGIYIINLTNGQRNFSKRVMLH